MMYMVKWSYPNRNAYCKAWAVSFSSKREAKKWKESFEALGDGRTASEVITVRHKPWYHLRNTLATRRFACADLAKAAKAYSDYIGSIGNECAYTDRLLEEVQNRLEKLNKVMADYSLHYDAATCPQAGSEDDPLLDK
jgi:hypothetical protein